MKRLFIALTALAVLFVIGLGITFASLDGVVVRAVELGGTRALGVETNLDSADVSVLRGHLALHGLRVANPEGFEEASFLSLQEGELDVTLTSLRSDLVEADRLLLSGLRLSLERNASGANYRKILDHLERRDSGAKEPGQPGEPREKGAEKPSKEPKRFVFHEVVLRDVRAHLDLLPLGGELTEATITIPEIRLEELGTHDGGQTLEELVAALTQVLLEAVVASAGDAIPADLLADLRDPLARLKGLDFELDRGAGAKLKELGGKALDKAGELGGKATEKAGELLDKLKKKSGDG